MDDWHDGWWEAGAVGRMTSQPAAVKLGFVCLSSHRQVYLAALCTWQSQTIGLNSSAYFSQLIPSFSKRKIF